MKTRLNNVDGLIVVECCKIAMPGDTLDGRVSFFEHLGCTVAKRQTQFAWIEMNPSMTSFDVMLPAGTRSIATRQYAVHPITIFVLPGGDLLTVMGATNETPVRTLVNASVSLLRSTIETTDWTSELRELLAARRAS